MIIPSGVETNAEYHASGAWGSSLVSTFINAGPRIAHMRLSGELPQEDSQALVIGSALHGRFDGSYDELFAAGPQVSSRRTKTWQEAAGKSTKKLLLPSEVRLIDNMEQAIRHNPYAGCLLEDSQHEVGIRQPLFDGLFQVQCRMDVFLPGGFIADIKTTGDIDGFPKSVMSFGYHRQAAFYRWLCERETGHLLPFSFIVVEKQAPHRCRVIDLDETYLAIGHQEIERALGQIAGHYREGTWDDPGYQLLEAPAWLRGRREEVTA